MRGWSWLLPSSHSARRLARVATGIDDAHAQAPALSIRRLEGEAQRAVPGRRGLALAREVDAERARCPDSRGADGRPGLQRSGPEPEVPARAVACTGELRVERLAQRIERHAQRYFEPRGRGAARVARQKQRQVRGPERSWRLT